MGFFLPSFWQKRILRFALSHIDLLDTDALDLDKLDIAIGKRSTVELRDVRKLPSVLQLPANIKIGKAGVSLVRLHIPADIYSSGITLEVDGVHVEATANLEGPVEGGRHDGRERGSSRTTRQHAREERSKGGSEMDSKEHIGPAIPTATDLAQSFLDTEPKEEKEQLKATISRSQGIDQSQVSENGDFDSEEGLGDGFSMPGFVAGFLAGIVSRIQAVIKHLRLDISLSLGKNHFGQSSSDPNAGETVVFRLSISQVNVGQVLVEGAPDIIQDEGRPGGVTSTTIGNRRVTVEGIKGTLFSDLALFSSLEQYSGPASPSTTHSGAGRKHGKSKDSPAMSDQASSSSDTGLGLTNSSFIASLHSTQEQETGLNHPQDTETHSQAQSMTEIQDDLGSSVQSFRSYDSSIDIDPDDQPNSQSPTQFESAHFSHGSVADGVSRSYQSFQDSASRFEEHLDTQDSLIGETLAKSSSQDQRTQQSQYLDALDSQHSTDKPQLGLEQGSEAITSSDSDIFDNQALSTASFRQSPMAQSGLHSQDLTQSRLFSHEEAESMYQSAISHAPTPLAAASWTSQRRSHSDLSHQVDMEDENAERSATPTTKNFQAKGTTTNKEDAEIKNRSFQLDEKLERSKNSSDSVKSKDSTPTTPSPELKKDLPVEETNNFTSMPSNFPSGLSNAAIISKRLLTVDTVTIDLPEKKDIVRPEAMSNVGDSLDDTRSNLHGLPGGFSSTIEEFTDFSHESPGFSKPENTGSSESSKLPAKGKECTMIGIKNVRIATDMSLVRLVAVIFGSIAQSTPQDFKDSDQTTNRMVQDVELIIDSIRWDLNSPSKGTIHGGAGSEASDYFNKETEPDILLSLRLDSTSLSQAQLQNCVQRRIMIGKVSFGYEDVAIIDFDSGLKMRESTRDILAPVGQDVKITIKNPENGPPDIEVMTLPIHFSLDLTRLDETFSWFGGLSSILELGNSMASTVTITEPKPNLRNSPKVNRAVRFDASLEQPQKSTEQKPTRISARIGGLGVDVSGKDASIALYGTAVKIISRREGIRVQIDKLNFRGPGCDAKLEIVKLEYLQFPREGDLDRLLALLCPSTEPGEPDDDILIDTFLRQRRQGGLLRLNIEGIRGGIRQKHELSRLMTMSDELKKLSTVAKYLPEDDRPGVLTLSRINQIDFEADINKSFGAIRINSKDIEVGHVSFPSLFLLGLGELTVKHGKSHSVENVLVDSRFPKDMFLSDSHQKPSVTVRLIGDELEPTLKVRLWRIRINYHVSTVMDLLGITEASTGEIIVNDLVQSVADLATQPTPPSLTRQTSAASTGSSTVSKSLKFDIGIRESVISLNPRASPAQGLLVFTNAQLFGSFPKQNQPEINASFEIQKMSILVVDDITNIRTGTAEEKQNREQSPADQEDQLHTLQKIGYVSVSDISSAKITISVATPTNTEERCVDVEVKNNLFVLETCADSTQTLQSIFSGLSPPMPPSKDLKYRTEVVPVQDMLASFTGESFTAEASEEDDTDYSTQLHEEDFVDDEIPQNIEFVNSFYNPEQYSSYEDGSLAGSGLSTVRNSRATGSQEVNISSAPLHFDENHFGTKPRSQEETHRWNSTRNAYEESREILTEKSPFTLKLRDVHLIWNLFDGFDWQRTRDTISNAVAEIETKAAERQAKRDKRKSLDEEEEEESVIGDFLFNSIYIGVSTNQNPKDLARQVNRAVDDIASEAESFATTTRTAVSASPSRQGFPRTRRKKLRLQRSRYKKMTFELKGVAVDVNVLPPGYSETQSSVDIRVQDFEIYDHVPTSTWKKFATYMHDAGERETGASMAHIKILNVKPDPQLAASEIVLKADILPLRLHVDQDALEFLSRFFEFKDEAATPKSDPSEAPFIQRAEVSSIPVKLDFKPKRVDYGGLRSGRTTEFMNFIVLDSADMVLRHVIIYGVSGFDKLGKTLNDIWMPDVKNNQLSGVLSGLAPVRSLVNVGSGVRDLVVIPMREYRKDGRVVRSIQKGALAFAKTTTTELAKLGAKLAIGTQTVLQHAEGALSSKPEEWESHTSESPPEEKPVISPYANPPVGVVQGLRGGYRHLERDLLLARDAIVAMPGEVMESGSAGGAARAVLKSAPTVILRPALGVSKAVGQVFMGATSALDKGERRRLDDKYKHR